MANRLIVDVTQLVHWPGKLTGIPRVMNELTIRYAAREDVIFAVWDTKECKMYQVNILETLARRGEMISYLHASNSHSKTPQPPMTTKRAATFATKAAKGILRRLDDRGVKPAGYVREKLSVQQKNSYKEVVVGKDDTFFVLWGEQHDRRYIDILLDYRAKGTKIAQISYDILPLITPQYSGHSTDSMYEYTKTIFPIADIVFSISNNTKGDIEKWLKSNKLAVPRVEVFRLGDDFQQSKQLKPQDEVFRKSALKGNDYALCVGTIEARKNHTLLYYVYKLAVRRGVELPKIVVVGRKGWRTEDIYDLIKNDPETKDKFVLLESVSDDELSWLYENALFSVYPSFYEGWGLPIAESIAYGTPCISSNTSSMPEIAGDLIAYFSPLSTDECLEAMRNLLVPDRLTKAKKTIEKYKPTSWDTTFEQVDKHIRSL